MIRANRLHNRKGMVIGMKRLLFGAFGSALSAVLLSAALCGCSTVLPGTDAPKLDQPFSAEAEIQFGSESCKAQIKRFSEKSWELCITEPYALEGLIVTIRDGETTLSMYGLEGFADFSEEAVSIAKLISDALDAAKDGTVSKNGELTAVTGDSENAHYMLTLDAAGKPSELTLSGRGVSMKLLGFAELPISEQGDGEEQNSEEDDEAAETYVTVE